ncbi:hypothetical protein Taro_012925 [Colocasia esculenta]|uniref:Uncharacterized protein n=1 Tax=Colocasia esculenta TaxID=4460 RepID=A0A843UEF4_COLES|nr:hypothetical protein [Colocasia esculenta]
MQPNGLKGGLGRESPISTTHPDTLIRSIKNVDLIFEVMDTNRVTRRKAKEIAIREQQHQINFMSDSNSALQMSQPQVGNTSHTPSSKNDGNSPPPMQTDTPSLRKRTRGPTRKMNIYNMPPGQHLKLEFDELNRPIGTNAIGFAYFLGSMACNGDLLPIDSKYELEDYHENYVVASLSMKWKDYKERLKKEYFNPDGDNPCPHQFIRISEINKGNRAKQQMVSTTGPKSIAIRQQEYVKIDQIVAGSISSPPDIPYQQWTIHEDWYLSLAPTAFALDLVVTPRSKLMVTSLLISRSGIWISSLSTLRRSSSSSTSTGPREEEAVVSACAETPPAPSMNRFKARPCTG